MDWSLLIGLMSIAVALLFGLLFGLSGFRKGITGELSAIREKVIAIQTTTEKVWDFILARFGMPGTIERVFKNLGKVRISAEPGRDETKYYIQIEKPVIVGPWIAKVSKISGLTDKEIEMFGVEGRHSALSKTQLVMHVPCTEAKLCTEYMSVFLKWLDSTYVESLTKLKEFEQPIVD